MKSRKLTVKEVEIIEYLAQKAGYSLAPNWAESVVAYPLTNDAIGAIGIVANNAKNYVSQRCHLIADCQFYDDDKVGVLVSLYVDLEKNLYELDFWKFDFSKILTIPPIDKMT